MTAKARYVVCVRNAGADDLEVRKLYRVIPDTKAESHGSLRVLDESGEDYVYPASFFSSVEISDDAARELAG